MPSRRHAVHWIDPVPSRGETGEPLVLTACMYMTIEMCNWDGYIEHCGLSHVRNRSPNTVIVTSVAAGNDVAVISWDSLQKGHRKDARSQERRLRRETMQAEHTSFLQEACTG